MREIDELRAEMTALVNKPARTAEEERRLRLVAYRLRIDDDDRAWLEEAIERLGGKAPTSPPDRR